MNLSEEIESLRKENQKLQENLERFNSFKTIINRLGRLLFIDPYHRITKKAYKIYHNYDINYKTKNFKPYQLNYKTEINKNAPTIIHLINNFKTGGASRIIVDIAENISNKYQHVVITRYNPSPQNYQGIKVEEFCHIPKSIEIKKILQKYSPTIIHIHWGTKWSVGDNTWQWYYSFFKIFETHHYKLIQNINLPIQPYLFKRECNYVFVSKYVEQNYAFSKKNNNVIYPGSDFSIFKSNKELRINKNIGMVYRLDDHKLKKESIEPFIEAIKIDNEIHVHIVGDGVLKSHFEARIKEENQVPNFTFYGYVPYKKLLDIYNILTLFIAPVYEESFGQVTPFAMNMGIPVLGYDTGALSEIINNKNCLVETGKFILLGKLIAQKINDKDFINQESKNVKSIAHLFSLNTMIKNYTISYDQ